MEVNQKTHRTIQEYWEDPDTVSIIDQNLHKLEIDAVCAHLKQSDYLADFGCGNAEATIEYARRVKNVFAMERSNCLRNIALENVLRSNLTNIKIDPGDLVQLNNIQPVYDVIVTQRCLINMPTWEDQKKAIMNIYYSLKPGGRYIMVENTNEAFQRLNQMRDELGLKLIPKHWHNLFFDYPKLMNFMGDNFRLLKEYDFSLYYFLTRVYTQMYASFEGFGIKAQKDAIFEKSDKTARMLYEKYHDAIKFKDAISIIQVFVFEKKDEKR